MPELPEVETVKNELAPYLIGRKVTDVTVLWDRTVKQPSVDELRTRLIGQKIIALSRRGKYLIATLSGGDFLIIHMKMSGSLLASRDSASPPPYTRAVIHLDDETRIFFRDPRKFGKIWLTDDIKTAMPELGPEPLENQFTPNTLMKLVKNRKAPIKALLTDQTLIAGIGNMYADEALFSARIHPLRPGASLTPKEIARLHEAIKAVLRAGIDDKGASIVNYYRPGGETGYAHFAFKVAHGRGKKCPLCGTPIERITVRNRGTYFCPRCQKAP
jgi:formamidopyrimidine-DNA glycosylase